MRRLRQLFSARPARTMISEGALSALKTPVNPPVVTHLIPLDQTVAPVDYEGRAAPRKEPVCPSHPADDIPLERTTAPVHYEGDTSSV